MRCITIAKTLEMAYSTQYDIVICDRGPLDGLFFEYKYLAEGKCTAEEVSHYMSFIEQARIKPDTLIALYTTPEEAIKRRGGEGRIVTKKWVEEYNSLLIPFYNDLEMSKNLVDTTDKSREQVKDILVDLIEAKFKEFKSAQ